MKIFQVMCLFILQEFILVKSDKWKMYEFMSFPNISLLFSKDELSDLVILKYSLELEKIKFAERNPRIFHTKSSDCRILPNFLLVKEILSINRNSKFIFRSLHSHICNVNFSLWFSDTTSNGEIEATVTFSELENNCLILTQTKKSCLNKSIKSHKSYHKLNFKCFDIIDKGTKLPIDSIWNFEHWLMIFIAARLVAENEMNIKVTTTTEKQPQINHELITEVLEEEVNEEVIENDNGVKTEMVSSKLSQFQDLIFNIDGFDAIVLSFAPLFLILILGLIFKINYFASTQKEIDLLRGESENIIMFLN